MNEIHTYQTLDGRLPYAEWLADLADRHARARVLVRVLRMAAGNFGDCKPLEGGVCELRIDGARAIASITPWPAARWCCCWSAATRGANVPTSPQR